MNLLARKLATKGRGILEPLQTAASLMGQVEELREVLEKNADLPVTLIGFSWGAWLSFILAANHSGYVKKLILVGSGPFKSEDARKIQEIRLNRLDEEDRAMFESAVKVLNDPELQDKSAAFAQFGAIFSKADVYEPIACEPEKIDYRFDIFKSVFNDGAKLRMSGELLKMGEKIKCPVVAIHGDYDPHPARGVVKPLSGILADFKFFLLEKCGHKPWIEKYAKDKFFQILENELL